MSPAIRTVLSLLIPGLLAGNLLNAAPLALSFSGLQPGEQVLDYYNGGFGGNGSGPGFDFGAAFTSGLAVRVVGPGHIPVGTGLDAILTAPSVVMTLRDPAGPLESLSFYYDGQGSVTLFSGPDATGMVVASRNFSGGGFPVSVFAAGSFQSVRFSGDENTVLNMISIGPSGVIPEPGAALLVLTGGLGLIFASRRLQK